MKKGLSALKTIKNSQKIEKARNKITTLSLTILLALSLASCKKGKTDYEIMENWQEKLDQEISEILNMNLDNGELIKAYNSNTTNLEMSYDYDKDNFIIVTSPLQKEYNTILEAAKDNASIQEGKTTYSIVSKEELQAPTSLIDFIEISFGTEDSRKFKALCFPEQGYCIVDESKKTFEYILKDTYYKIQLDQNMPDEYFGDFANMPEYIQNTKKLTDNEFKTYLKNQNIIATNSDWHKEIYK